MIKNFLLLFFVIVFSINICSAETRDNIIKSLENDGYDIHEDRSAFKLIKKEVSDDKQPIDGHTRIHEDGKIYDFKTIKPNYIVVSKNGKYGAFYLKENKKDDFSRQKMISLGDMENYVSNKDSLTVWGDKTSRYTIHFNNQYKMPVEYDFLKEGDFAYIFCKDNKCGVISRDTNQVIMPARYDYIDCCEDFGFNEIRGFKIYKDKKAGFADYTKNTLRYILPCNYDEVIHYISQNHEFILRQNNKLGVVNVSNGQTKQVLPFEYDEISVVNPEDGFYVKKYYLLKKNNKYGVADTALQNKILIPVEYDEISYPQDICKSYFIKVFTVRHGNKKGVYSACVFNNYSKDRDYEKFLKYNRLFVPVSFDDIEIEHNGCVVSQNNQKGYYHIDKGLFIPVKYSSVKTFRSQNDRKRYIVYAENGKEKVTKDIPKNAVEKQEDFEVMLFNIKLLNPIFFIQWYLDGLISAG